MSILTQHQSIVLTGFTGVLMCNFSDFHKDVEKRLGRPVWTHQFADQAVMNEIKEAYKEDFHAILNKESCNECHI